MFWLTGIFIRVEHKHAINQRFVYLCSWQERILDLFLEGLTWLFFFSWVTPGCCICIQPPTSPCVAVETLGVVFFSKWFTCFDINNATWPPQSEKTQSGKNKISFTSIFFFVQFFILWTMQSFLTGWKCGWDCQIKSKAGSDLIRKAEVMLFSLQMHGCIVLCVLASQGEGAGSNPNWDLFVCSPSCSPCAYMGFYPGGFSPTSFLPLLKTRFIG